MWPFWCLIVGYAIRVVTSLFGNLLSKSKPNLTPIFFFVLVLSRWPHLQIASFDSSLTGMGFLSWYIQISRYFAVKPVFGFYKIRKFEIFFISIFLFPQLLRTAPVPHPMLLLYLTRYFKNNSVLKLRSQRL